MRQYATARLGVYKGCHADKKWGTMTDAPREESEHKTDAGRPLMSGFMLTVLSVQK